MVDIARDRIISGRLSRHKSLSITDYTFTRSSKTVSV